jgi:hypothetical protein
MVLKHQPRRKRGKRSKRGPMDWAISSIEKKKVK